MADKNLEKVMHKSVKPVVDEAMHRFLGVTIDELSRDISDRLESGPLFPYAIETGVSFKAAKKMFKRQFLKKMIQSHFGNVSMVAKIANLNRRSVHRAINELDINVGQCRKDMQYPGYFRKEAVDSILKATLDSYKSVIHPQKLEQMYHHVPSLSEDIIKILPIREMSWKEAEHEFERKFLKNVLDANRRNITLTAKKIRLRYETLLRKIKKLGI